MEIIKSIPKNMTLIFSMLISECVVSQVVENNEKRILTISANSGIDLQYVSKNKSNYYKLLVSDDNTVISFTKKGSNFSVDMSEDNKVYELKCTSYIQKNNINRCIVNLHNKGLYDIRINNLSKQSGYIRTYQKNRYKEISKGYCYQEDLNQSADISDLKRKFNKYNWLQTIQSIYQRRWKGGELLVKEQANDPYFSQFVNKSSFNKMAESLMVAIHEETHMYDLDYRRTDWEQKITAFVNQHWQPKVPIHGGFPRKEIIPLIESNVTKPWDDIYLRNSTQGNYLMQGVLSELNAGLTGLVGVAVVGENVEGYGASNAIDSAAAYMYHFQLYLRKAEQSYPDYYQLIASEQLFKDFIIIQWLRLHYYIDLATKFSKIGTDYQRIVELLLRPYNIKAIENFTGHSVLIDTHKNCLPGDDPFKPPF